MAKLGKDERRIKQNRHAAIIAWVVAVIIAPLLLSHVEYSPLLLMPLINTFGGNATIVIPLLCWAMVAVLIIAGCIYFINGIDWTRGAEVMRKLARRALIALAISGGIIALGIIISMMFVAAGGLIMAGVLIVGLPVIVAGIVSGILSFIIWRRASKLADSPEKAKVTKLMSTDGLPFGYVVAATLLILALVALAVIPTMFWLLFISSVVISAITFAKNDGRQKLSITKSKLQQQKAVRHATVGENARDNYKGAAILWVLSAIVFASLFISGDVSAFLVRAGLALILAIAGAIAYSAGNKSNNNYEDVAKRVHRMRTVVIICWVVALIAAVLIAGTLTRNTNSPTDAYGGLVIFMFSAIIGLITLTLAVTFTIIIFRSKKRLKSKSKPKSTKPKNPRD